MLPKRDATHGARLVNRKVVSGVTLGLISLGITCIFPPFVIVIASTVIFVVCQIGKQRGENGRFYGPSVIGLAVTSFVFLPVSIGFMGLIGYVFGGPVITIALLIASIGVPATAIYIFR